MAGNKKAPINTHGADRGFCYLSQTFDFDLTVSRLIYLCLTYPSTFLYFIVNDELLASPTEELVVLTILIL
jgi:hypothetical protein